MGETPVVAGNSRVGVYAEGHVTADTITVAYYDHLTADRDSTWITSTTLYQEPASTITGVIKDINGNLIDFALLHLYNTDNSVDMYAVSRSDGSYAFYDVPAGEYILYAKRDGYQIFRTMVEVP